MYKPNFSRSSINTVPNNIICKNEQDNHIDTIQCILWNNMVSVNENKGFFTGGWDGYVKYYQVVKGSSHEELYCRWKFFVSHPVISIAFNHANILFVGLATGQIFSIHLGSGKNEVLELGFHDAPINGIFWVRQYKVIISIGFDKKMKMWSQEKQINNTFMLADFTLPEKIYSSSYEFPYLLLAGVSKIAILNLANMNSIQIPNSFQSIKEIQIYSKIKCSAIRSKLKTFALGTQDGKTVIGQFEDYINSIKIKQTTISISQKKQSISKIITYPVNSVVLGVHQQNLFFINSGSIQMSIFNIYKNQKIKTINTSITATDISSNGQYIIYAQGYGWQTGLSTLKNNIHPKIKILKLRNEQLQSLIAKI